mmetsp:Transcript_19212/g.26023  ORF Transcript_19212/g.26023 Transcript_19212/m.26023 type:complete len:287 (-) Transcript_19212:1348-2208(-)
MLVLLSDLDALIPAMKLLVHSHGLLDLIVLNENSLCLMELLVEDGHLGLDAEVLGALRRDKLVQLAEIVGLGDVTEGGVAALSHVEVVLLHGELGESLPVGLSLRSQVELLQDVDSGVETAVLEGSAKLNEALIEFVRDGVATIVDENLGLVLGALDALDVTLDLVHGDLVWLLDRVPDAEVGAVLGNDDVGVRHPADELAVVEQALFGLLLNAVKVQLLALVSEEQLCATGVQLEVVNLGVVADVGLNLARAQVLDADSHLVEQVGDDLGGLTAVALLLRVVEAG